MQQAFQVASLPTTTSTVLVEMVIRLLPEPAAASTMAEDIPQPATRKPCPVEGLQHLTTTLAYSCNHRDPSWEGQQCPYGQS
jgi:hypothetical protein